MRYAAFLAGILYESVHKAEGWSFSLISIYTGIIIGQMALNCRLDARLYHFSTLTSSKRNRAKRNSWQKEYCPSLRNTINYGVYGSDETKAYS
jgi:hypothetical protein